MRHAVFIFLAFMTMAAPAEELGHEEPGASGASREESAPAKPLSRQELKELVRKTLESKMLKTIGHLDEDKKFVKAKPEAGDILSIQPHPFGAGRLEVVWQTELPNDRISGTFALNEEGPKLRLDLLNLEDAKFHFRRGKLSHLTVKGRKHTLILTVEGKDILKTSAESATQADLDKFLADAALPEGGDFKRVDLLPGSPRLTYPDGTLAQVYGNPKSKEKLAVVYPDGSSVTLMKDGTIELGDARE